MKIADGEKEITLKKLPDLPVNLILGTACYFENKIYLFGGVEYNAPDKINSNCQIHIFDEGKWSSSGDLLLKRVEGSILVSPKS